MLVLYKNETKKIINSIWNEHKRERKNPQLSMLFSLSLSLSLSRDGIVLKLILRRIVRLRMGWFCIPVPWTTRFVWRKIQKKKSQTNSKKKTTKKERVHNWTNQHQSLHALCTISHQRVSIWPSIYFVLLEAVAPYIFNNQHFHYHNEIECLCFSKEDMLFNNILSDINSFGIISEKIVCLVQNECSFDDLSTLVNELLKFIRFKNARFLIRCKFNTFFVRTLLNQIFCRFLN
jgi:hypothetical protein